MIYRPAWNYSFQVSPRCETLKRGLNWDQSTGDGFVLPLLVAIAIGRLGCQMSGLSDLTYGNVTSLISRGGLIGVVLD